MGVFRVFKILQMVPNRVKRLILWKNLIVIITLYLITGQLICNANSRAVLDVSFTLAWFHIRRSLRFISNIFEKQNLDFYRNFSKLVIKHKNILYSVFAGFCVAM